MTLLQSESGAVETETSSGEGSEGTAETRGADLALIASAASVLLAWHQFYLKGNKTRGLFIGLWPPTILAFSSYLNQRAILDKLDQSLLGSPGGLDSIRRLLGE
ncbi:hypothetical protein [Halohasta salina]|uniref:hypothetical protein n=1 Tax=Halohasta salina TaxID=2961621 RepID=UPI0020A4853C|nr:hypothetical protein [Halohasta salina]